MGDKKSNLSPWCHPNQLLTSFISWTTIWSYLVCLILVLGTVSSHKAVNSGGWGGGVGDLFIFLSSLAFYSSGVSRRSLAGDSLILVSDSGFT